MRKIPTVFERDFDNKAQITPKPHPDCDWVFRGEGVATRKYDGTCCLVRDGKLYKRREVKVSDKVPLPSPFGFEMTDWDETTRKAVGWVPVDPADPGDKWHCDALADDASVDQTGLADGTYELIGPKVQGNAERVAPHLLIAHAEAKQFSDVPTDFDALREWMEGKDIEGIVWHHPDGRMAKIKLKDFGLKRVQR